MIDIQYVRANPDQFDAQMASRGSAFRASPLLVLDDLRRQLATQIQAEQSARNALSGQIGAAMKAGDRNLADLLKTQVQAIKERLTALEYQHADIALKAHETFAEVPNYPARDVPVGPDETANVVVSTWGASGTLGRPHYELGPSLGLMDFETAARLSGSRYTVLYGALARLERAIGQFMIDHNTGKGYREVSVPLIVNESALFNTGQLPKFVDDLYGVGSASDFEAGQFLIPTAEVPLTNLVADQIVEESRLPMRLTALTPCFRAEAGSAGRDVRGMLRQHQFMKCELVSICSYERAPFEHMEMLGAATDLLKLLELPHRVMKLSTGDMGFSAARTYDVEVWMPGQATFREISSISWCGDFQARRMGARHRGPDGKTQFLHTLNGSGLAVGRTLIAIMENHQNTDGSINVPSVLAPYMGGVTKINREEPT
jgi:seryl-tRNA synthetase